METTLHAPRPQAALPSPIFDHPDSNFRESYNRNSFQFRHHLAGHPLFELPRLAALAETLLQKEGPKSVFFHRSNAAGELQWSEVPPAEQRKKITESIADLQNSGSRMLLYRAQTDPDYRQLMDQIISEVEAATGAPLSREITWRDAYIFLASPQCVTPYHIDHESTFLFQIHGSRVASIWDREDRSVLTSHELENYYTGNIGSAKLREENKPKATIYSMTAGSGVHHPVLAPHEFKNGPTYSIALGVHFCLRDWDRQARIHQFNACLRRLHLRPTPPGISAWRDRAKIGALGLLSKRNPKNKYELIRSGFMRLVSPLAFIPGAKKRLLK